jgi:hypothetical protein
VHPQVLAYLVDVCRATRSSPAAALGVSPRGGTALLAASRAWAWLSGRDFVTPDDVKALARPTLRHRHGCAPRRSWTGPPPTAWSTGCWPPCGPPLSRGAHRAHRAARGARGSSSPAAAPGWWARRAGGWRRGVADLVLPRRRAALTDSAGTRGGPGRRGHGAPPCTTPDAAPAPGCCATPGRPGGRRPARHDCTVPPGSAPAHAALRPPAAATGGPRGSRCARSGRWGSPPARARTRCPGRCGRCRRSPRGGTCPRGWPGCASWTGAPRRWCAGRAPSSTRCARTWPVTTSGRSTGGPAPGRPRSWSAPGARSATGTCCWSWTPAGPRPAASGTPRSSTWRWTPRCCWARWRRGRATGWTCSPTTGRCAPGWSGPAGRAAGFPGARHGPRWSRPWWRPTTAPWSVPPWRARPAAAWSCCSPGWTRPGCTRACCRRCRCWPSGTASSSPRSPTGRRGAGGGPGGLGRGVRGGRGRAGRAPSAGTRRACWAAWA